jgi:hypothetical protein
MKIFFLTGILFVLTYITGCDKSNDEQMKPPLTPDVAENYLTNGPWIFSGSFMEHHAVIYDSVAFFFKSRTAANEYLDSIAAYYPMGRLIIFTLGRFIVSSTYNTPDTLISPFSPYTTAGNKLDTFLIQNLSNTLFLMKDYSAIPASYPIQQDSLIRK